MPKLDVDEKKKSATSSIVMFVKVRTVRIEQPHLGNEDIPGAKLPSVRCFHCRNRVTYLIHFSHGYISVVNDGTRLCTICVLPISQNFLFPSAFITVFLQMKNKLKLMKGPITLSSSIGEV